MTKEEIQEAVRNHKCHGAYFCTVATQVTRRKREPGYAPSAGMKYF